MICTICASTNVESTTKGTLVGPDDNTHKCLYCNTEWKAPTHKLTIDRNIWLRGEGSDKSFLYRPKDGKQCCVGIYLEACGVPKAELAGRQEARVFAPHLPIEATWTAHYAADELYSQNDYERYGYDAEREREIIRIFGDHGVEVEFIN